MNNSKFRGLGFEKNAVDLQLEGNTMGGAKHTEKGRVVVGERL